MPETPSPDRRRLRTPPLLCCGRRQVPDSPRNPRCRRQLILDASISPPSSPAQEIIPAEQRAMNRNTVRIHIQILQNKVNKLNSHKKLTLLQEGERLELIQQIAQWYRVMSDLEFEERLIEQKIT